MYLTRFRGGISHQEEFLHAAVAKPISFSGIGVYFFMWELIKSQDVMVAFVFLLIFFSPQKLTLFCLFWFFKPLVKFWSLWLLWVWRNEIVVVVLVPWLRGGYQAGF